MLLLALLLPPLALYLIVLGWINGRRRPVIVGGAWDFAGVLFALSGFLLAGGPAVLGSLDEQSRLFWLLGDADSSHAAAGNGAFWIALRVLYFVVVSAGAALLLWRSRRLTSIYNLDAPTAFTTLDQAFQWLGLTPLRSGDSFLIGDRTPEAATKPPPEDAITTAGAPSNGTPATLGAPVQPVALQVDAFPLTRHVTLRWDPADGPLRREVERELARALAEVQPPESDPTLGWMLMMLGVAALLFALFGGAFVLMHNLIQR